MWKSPLSQQIIPIKIKPFVDFSSTFPQAVENSVEKKSFAQTEIGYFVDNSEKSIESKGSSQKRIG